MTFLNMNSNDMGDSVWQTEMFRRYMKISKCVPPYGGVI